MLRLVIDGRSAACTEGATILDALRAAQIDVPTLCHDNRLVPYGGCRLCIVQVAGLPRPVTACTTPAIEGMRIETHTPEIETLRRSLLKLIANEYPAAAYHRDPDKEFHRYICEYHLAQPIQSFHLGKRQPSRAQLSGKTANLLIERSIPLHVTSIDNLVRDNSNRTPAQNGRNGWGDS